MMTRFAYKFEQVVFWKEQDYKFSCSNQGKQPGKD